MTVKLLQRNYLTNTASQRYFITPGCRKTINSTYNEHGKPVEPTSSSRLLRLEWESIKPTFDTYSTTLFPRVSRVITRKQVEQGEMASLLDVSCFTDMPIKRNWNVLSNPATAIEWRKTRKRSYYKKSFSIARIRVTVEGNKCWHISEKPLKRRIVDKSAIIVNPAQNLRH